MIAIMSDVHGNLEALRAVLQHMGPAEEVFCAGDIVGYGPNPNECCELMRELGVRCVQGNHDFVCANLALLDAEDSDISDEDRELCRRFYNQKNTAAQAASRWTSSVLTDENRRFLRELPLVIDETNLTMVHGKPGSKADMLNEYMLPGAIRLHDADDVVGQILVVGHSHIPMQLANLVNPGSVGQPRDRNWQASYATMRGAWYRFSYVKEEDMTFRMVNQLVETHRVPYDVQTTAQKIKDEPGIPDSLGDRLMVGL